MKLSPFRILSPTHLCPLSPRLGVSKASRDLNFHYIPKLAFLQQDDQSESAGEKKRESAKNLSDSVTEQSDDSSVTQDDPTPSTLLSLYTLSSAFYSGQIYIPGYQIRPDRRLRCGKSAKY